MVPSKIVSHHFSMSVASISESSIAPNTFASCRFFIPLNLSFVISIPPHLVSVVLYPKIGYGYTYFGVSFYGKYGLFTLFSKEYAFFRAFVVSKPNESRVY